MLYKKMIGITVVIIIISIFGCNQGSDKEDLSIRLKKPRVSPLKESEWPAELKDALERLKKDDGQIHNIYTTLAHYPKFFINWGTFGAYTLYGSSLPPRDREILILRIGWLCKAEYEFGHHTVIGKKVGLTDEEIYYITKEPDIGKWTLFEKALILAADELHRDAFITNNTWNRLLERYTKEQIVDLIATVGNYNLVCMILNTLGIQLEKNFPGIPEAPVF
jgi:4-carboxymuconolactone decarboxylase